jgi:lysophospholipase L1-like esterase
MTGPARGRTGDHRSTAVGWLSAGIALAIAMAASEIAAQQRPQARWTTAWATSQQTLGMTTVTDATIRMIARVTIPGDAVRVRLDNTFGKAPLVVRAARIGQRIQGAALAAGSNRPLTFDRSDTVTIPPGGTVTSDSVPMNVLGQQDLAVSLYIPDSNVQPSQHTDAKVTSYLTAASAGDKSADETAAPFVTTTMSTFWLKAIDVSSSAGVPASPGSIVAFGDSITDGTCSTLDAHDRWEDWLSVRLGLDAASRGPGYKAVVNEGIGGNTVTREKLQPAPDSPPGLERLDRDVLSHHGVTDVILFMGTNDIRRNAPASQVITGLQELIARIKAGRLRVVGVTIIPRHNRPPADGNTGWDAAKTAVRHEVNEWIRTKAAFDRVIDFERTVRDATTADMMAPAFNCGDGIHPSPRGYYEMGRSVALDFFR